MRSLAGAATLIGAIALSGCAAVGPYQTPATDLPEPTAEELALDREQLTAWNRWWEQFDDPELIRLVDQATRDNLDLHMQVHRVTEARAMLGLARAEQLPTVGAQAEASRERTPGAAFPFDSPSSTTTLFSVAGLLDYELDLWGRLAAEREATEAMLAENRYGLEAVRLNVIADVVTTYFELRMAERQLEITRQALASREETLHLESVRVESGQSDELVQRQARAQLEAIRAELPFRRQRAELLKNALAVLVGVSPAELAAGPAYAGASLEALTRPGIDLEALPATLLQRRPDVRAAEAALMAAHANTGVARASRLPRISLSGMLGSVAQDESDLFSSSALAWGASGSVFAPVVDMGRARARVDAAQARRDQAETAWRATTLNALREARDALTTYQAGLERITATRELIRALERTVELAEIRYEEGYVSHIELLDARRGLLDAELTLAESTGQHLAATATLFKALGGGWFVPEGADASIGPETH